MSSSASSAPRGARFRNLVSTLLLAGGAWSGFDALTDTLLEERKNLAELTRPVAVSTTDAARGTPASFLKSLVFVAALVGAVAVSGPSPATSGELRMAPRPVAAQIDRVATPFVFPLRIERDGALPVPEFITLLNRLDVRFGQFIDLNVKIASQVEAHIDRVRFDEHSTQLRAGDRFVRGTIVTVEPLRGHEHAQIEHAIDEIFHLKHRHAEELQAHNRSLSSYRALAQAIDDEWDALATARRNAGS